MPNIKPVTDLRNYGDVLKGCRLGEPVYLTKNGRGRYVLVDINEFDRMQAELALLAKLADGEASAENNGGWISAEDSYAALGIEK